MVVSAFISLIRDDTLSAYVDFMFSAKGINTVPVRLSWNWSTLQFPYFGKWSDKMDIPTASNGILTAENGLKLNAALQWDTKILES